MMLCKSLGGGAAMWLALTASAWAQDAPPPAADAVPAAAPPATEAVGQFDADKDGQLLGEELDRARDFLRALRGAVGDRGRNAGPPSEGGGDGDRPMRERGGREGRGERGRRGGPPPAGDAPPFEIGDGAGPPRPEPLRDGDHEARPPQQRPDQVARLFREFDDNEDGQLNREEFTALMGALRERRGPGAAEGPRGDAIGPPERPEGRRGFGEGGGPPRGRRGGEGFGPPRGDGREGDRRPPRDGDVGRAFQPDQAREVA